MRQVSPEQLYAFRWPIFFGAIFPFFCISRWLTNKVYHIIEVSDIVVPAPAFNFMPPGISRSQRLAVTSTRQHVLTKLL